MASVTHSMVTFFVLCFIGIVSSSSVIPLATTFVSSNLTDPYSELSSTFYATKCPLALLTIKAYITAVVLQEPRMGASLLRLHFHDCFVQVSLVSLYSPIHFNF
jgi:peroxidase